MFEELIIQNRIIFCKKLPTQISGKLNILKLVVGVVNKKIVVATAGGNFVGVLGVVDIESFFFVCCFLNEGKIAKEKKCEKKIRKRKKEKKNKRLPLSLLVAHK